MEYCQKECRDTTTTKYSAIGSLFSLDDLLGNNIFYTMFHQRIVDNFIHGIDEFNYKKNINSPIDKIVTTQKAFTA